MCGTYLRGVERLLDTRLNPEVASVAAVFISRWDTVASTAPVYLRNQLGIAIGKAQRATSGLEGAVLGGDAVKELGKRPPLCRAGSNADAFVGGFLH